MRLRTHGTNITILENSTAEIGGVQIIGATLWTDFLLSFGGSGPELKLPFRKNTSIDACQKFMVDFRAIFGSPSYGAAGLIWPDEMIGRHEESRSFITSELAKPFPGRRTVVAHHAPRYMAMFISFSITKSAIHEFCATRRDTTRKERDFGSRLS